MKVNIEKLQEKYNERIKKIGKNKLRIIITPSKGNFHLDISKMKIYLCKSKRPKYRPIKKEII